MNPYRYAADNGGIRQLLDTRWPEGATVQYDDEAYEEAVFEAIERRWVATALNVLTVGAVIVALVVAVAVVLHLAGGGR